MMRLISIFILSLALSLRSSKGFSVDYVVNKLKSVQGLFGSLSLSRGTYVIIHIYTVHCQLYFITATQTHQIHGDGHRPKRKIVSESSSTGLKSSLQTEEGFLTDSRGRRLKTFTWLPSGPVRGLVFLTHGFVSIRL